QSNLNNNLSSFSKNQTHLSFKCYQILFNRTEPCPNCNRGKKFELNFDKNYEVFSQSLKFDHENQSVFVNFYHDITDRKIFETQLIERAKLAELGTIGSSIAHELNNPLGGMLSFTQLIKAELKENSPYYSDILEIEKGILRSKNIVQNLLNFSRRSDLEDSTTVSLSEAFERAISILALKTKQLNLSFKILLPPEEDFVMGSTNLLAQAFKNILILVIDRIEKEIAQANAKTIANANSGSNSKWEISIQNQDETPVLEKKFRKVLIHIDDSDYSFSNKSLNLEQIQPDQLTLRILSDHQIQLTPTPTGPQLTFLRPVFRSRKP
ncbi:MAG TPA: histidine kinase dimerization/phospho-acceptor domain-containing protein, partial [Pseudobdellovibrionaceae bacterium]|nr:histidine kinase dimerization/phospho-acceptor domain-containing protein [Pseudobdellovibrionaceae bacterium]